MPVPIMAMSTSGAKRERCGVDNRKLRKQCRQLVASLDIPVPFDIEQLSARLGSRRGRPLHLIPFAMPPDGPCGVWIATANLDAIFYEARTSRLHQEHIIGHEIGHLLCDHSGVASGNVELIKLLVPGCDPAFVWSMFSRAGYSAREERAAEMIADLLLCAADRCRPEPSWTVPAGFADILARLRSSLEYDRARCS